MRAGARGGGAGRASPICFSSRRWKKPASHGLPYGRPSLVRPSAPPPPRSFLRFNGKVRNRNLTLPAVRAIVNDMMAIKLLNADTTPIPVFFYHYLQKKYGVLQPVIVDWAYNIITALEQKGPNGKRDPLCQLFDDMLHEEREDRCGLFLPPPGRALELLLPLAPPLPSWVLAYPLAGD